MYSSALQCTPVYSSVLQCTPVYSSVLQCTPVHSSLLWLKLELLSSSWSCDLPGTFWELRKLVSVPGAATPRRSGGSKPIEWFRRVAPKRGSGDREMVIVLRASAFDDECFPFPKQKLKQPFVNICAPEFGIDRCISNSSYPDVEELMCWPEGVRSLSKGTATYVDFEGSDPPGCDIGGFAEAWNKDTRVQACCLMAICDRIVRQRCENEGGYLWSDGDLEKEVVGLSRIVEVAIREYDKAEADDNSGADDGEEASKL